MNNFLSFQIHGNAEIGGASSVLENFLLFLSSLVGKSISDIFFAIMPGLAAMANIHPMLVHFPIAFLSSFVLLDVFATLANKPQWRKFATCFLYCGTVMAMFTVMAGFVAANSVEHSEKVHEIMERHEAFGIMVLSLATILSIWRLRCGDQLKGDMNTLHLIIATMLGLCLALGADLGGLMVYKYGVAVKAVPVSSSQAHHKHTH
jgi:uncharacterized membrane protein